MHSICAFSLYQTYALESPLSTSPSSMWHWDHRFVNTLLTSRGQEGEVLGIIWLVVSDAHTYMPYPPTRP